MQLVSDGTASVCSASTRYSYTSLRSLSLGEVDIADLRPLADTRIERLSLWGSGPRGTGDWVVDLAALAEMPALKEFDCRVSSYVAGKPIRMRTAFDNERVLRDLQAAGVVVTTNFRFLKSR